MNWDLICALIFYVILIGIFYKNKKNVTIQGIFALYRTKLGMKSMDWGASKFRGFLKFVSYIGIIVGFSGMGFIFYFLIKGTIGLFNGGEPALAPVLPGVSVSGLPTLGFWHWIIAIFFVAVVHEFSHGLFARVYKIKLKSTGFALFGPILAAFVEPDEKKLAKKSNKSKLSVFSAGPFSNIIFGLLFLLMSIFIMSPLQSNYFELDGITVNGFITGYPASESGLTVPFKIYSLNGVEILTTDDFVSATDGISPGDKVLLGTNQGEFEIVSVANPEDSSKGFIGIQNFSLENKLIEGHNAFYGSIVKWFSLLIFWLFVVNIGVGLFNLLPLGPVDGGRMFKIFSIWLTKSKKVGNKLYRLISWFVLLLILINLWPYIVKLFLFLAKPLLWLMGL